MANMTTRTESRKRLFLAALALSGLSITDWAKLNGRTQGHVSQVLSGQRESEKLTDEIDAFIRNCSGLKRSKVA